MKRFHLEQSKTEMYTAQAGLGLIPPLDDASVTFLARSEVPITALSTGHVALDMDVFPKDNSRTLKEGVSYTY